MSRTVAAVCDRREPRSIEARRYSRILAVRRNTNVLCPRACFGSLGFKKGPNLARYHEILRRKVTRALLAFRFRAGDGFGAFTREACRPNQSRRPHQQWRLDLV